MLGPIPAPCTHVASWGLDLYVKKIIRGEGRGRYGAGAGGLVEAGQGGGGLGDAFEGHV